MVKPVEIRLADAGDLEAILELILQNSLSQAPQLGGPTEQQRRAFAIIAEHPDNEILVATRGDEVVGTLQLTYIPGLAYDGGWRAQVEAVRVRGDCRNLGLGSQLMNWAIERARKRGCRLMQLTTNRARIDAQRFYGRLGFTPSHVGMKLLL